MKRSQYFRNVAFGLIWGLLCGVMFSSCNHSFLYEGEGDCSIHYQVRFRYDYNMKYADAFAHEVSTVTLYVVNTRGEIVLQRTESGSALAQEGYMMEFDDTDIAPGTYSLLVWCGTKDYGSFTVPASTTARGLTCTLERSHATDGTAYEDTDLDRWFYGYLDTQSFPGKEGTYVYTVSLIKDTNIFRVVLQHLSGGDVDKDQFIFTITDSNGEMDWDNSLLTDELITYYAWHTDQGSAEVETTGGSGTFSAAIAELTTARLVQGQAPRLTVLNRETEETVFSIPLIDYALMVKGFYNRDMGDQEFLDRQDEWDMVFFLDNGDRWVDTYIYINSWKIVLQSAGL